jgi:hypothetical protein
MITYRVERAATTPELKGLWDGPAWGKVPTLKVDQFHPKSISRHPKTEAKVVHTPDAVWVHFQVQDAHVQSVFQNPQDSVCQDSCVEFFVKPKTDKGYLNFEINCSGTMLLYYIWDHKTKPGGGGFNGYKPVEPEWFNQVKIYHSMPRRVDPPVAEPTTWRIEYRIPRTLFENYVGPLGDFAGQTWRANFYKCGGDKAYNHWAEWSSVELLNFHQPDMFGAITFAG